MKVDEIITERIIEALERGTIAWRKTWRPGEMPQNAITRRPYRGINAMLLNLTDYSRPYFLTYKQTTELGGFISKGEKGHPVVFWKVSEREERDDETGEMEIKKSFILRYYTVFNVSQTEGIDWDAKLPELDKEIDPIAEADAVIDGYRNPPTITETSGDQAYYRPSTDIVNVPGKAQFEEPPFFYSVLFHELVHSTGHDSRLKRGIANGFHDERYSKEELVAEMGAAFLCGRTGIERDDMIENSAAYIAGWLEALKNDKRLVINAAAKAQRAVDYMIETEGE